jgi:hypothetical protein
MHVYPFLPAGGGMPFAKPRFAVRGETLEQVNLPLISPEAIVATPRIADLPAVEYDPAYEPPEWDWHFFDSSYAIRFMFSVYRPFSVGRAAVSPEQLRSINGALLQSFVRLAQENGSKPVVVLFPFVADFTTPEWRAGPRAVMESSQVPYVDMSDCVSRVGLAERFVTLHYSATTNAAVARCLRDLLDESP